MNIVVTWATPSVAVDPTQDLANHTALANALAAVGVPACIFFQTPAIALVKIPDGSYQQALPVLAQYDPSHAAGAKALQTLITAAQNWATMTPPQKDAVAQTVCQVLIHVVQSLQNSKMDI